MIMKSLAILLLMSSAAIADDPDFGKDPDTGEAYISRLGPLAVPFTKTQIDVKELHDFCVGHPFVPSTDAKTGQVTWSNGEYWPRCAEIESQWTLKGPSGESISERYDRALSAMPSMMDKLKIRVGH